MLVVHATGDTLVATHSDGSTFMIRRTQLPGTATSTDQFSFGTAANAGGAPKVVLTPAQARAQIERDRALAQHQHDAEMHQLLEQSGIALALMAALSIALGWLAAGRVLRPLRTLNERAREITASSLHKRIALTGPDDELKQLADTFDDVLGRLETSFAAQRQFVANASHELRTPLARAQAVAEVALGDPDATVASLSDGLRRVIVAGEQQERVIEALLTLARSERGLDERTPFDLAELTDLVLAAREGEAAQRGIDVHPLLAPAQAAGEPHLAERLVTNLVDNALRHNVRDGGLIEVATVVRDGRAFLTIANTGPAVAPEDVERLFRPFERLGRNRIDRSDGVGLGLSIVQAIATAHRAQLTVRPRLGGGLVIEVGFPAPEATGPSARVAPKLVAVPLQLPVPLARYSYPRAPPSCEALGRAMTARGCSVTLPR